MTRDVTIRGGPSAIPAEALQATRQKSPMRVLSSMPGDVGAAFQRSLGNGSWMDAGSGLGMRQAIGATDESENLEDAYKQEPWVFACVDLFAIVASGIRPHFYDRDPEDPQARELPEGHPVRALFEHVNDLMDPSLLAISDAQAVSLTGETFWFLRNRDGSPPVGVPVNDPSGFVELPDEIWPVRGDLVREIVDRSTGMLTHWEVPTAGGGRVKWPASAVVQFYERPDTDRPWRGLGRLAAAYGTSAQNYLARRYQNILLRNIGDPGGVVVSGGFLSDTEYDRAVAQLDENWGQDNAGQTKLLEGDVKYIQGKTSPRDMQYEKLLLANKGDISAVFQTAPGLLGADVENYATYAGRFRTYIFTRIAPYFALRAARLNSSFFPRLRHPDLQGIRIAYDLTKIQAAVGDLALQGAGLTALTAAGVPLNQALGMVGLPSSDPIDGGDIGLVSESLVPNRAAIVLGQAKAAAQLAEAAGALQANGLDPAQVFQMVGMETIPTVTLLPPPKPEVPEVTEAPEKILPLFSRGGVVRPGLAILGEAPAEPVGFERGALLEHPNKQVPANPDALSSNVTRGKKPKRSKIAEWRRFKGLQSTDRRKMDAAIKRVFFQMRTAQLRALEDYAKTGEVSRAHAFSDVAPADLRKGLLDADKPYPMGGIPMGRLSDAEKTTLLRAFDEDQEEEQRFRAVAPEKLYRTVHACDGETGTRVAVAWRPNLTRWLKRHPRFKAHGLEGLEDLCLVLRAEITPQEIEAILVVQDQKWAEAIGSKIEAGSRSAYSRIAKDIAKELGVDIIDLQNPDVLRFFSQKAIEVAEGTQSVIAQRMRRDVLRTLAKGDGIGDLQAQIMENLADLKAATTSAFNSHAARALAIARTEVGGASNGARFETLKSAYAEGLIESIEWFTSGRAAAPAGTVRPSHHGQNGERRIPGERFSNGLLFPLAPGAPPGEVVNCFPAGTPVEGRFTGGLKAWYSGQMVEVFAGGHRVRVTPNHPIATPEGFVAAKDLREGDYVVCAATGNDAPSKVEHGPSAIAQVFRTLRRAQGSAAHSPRRVDLHGDALHVQGQVDVVPAGCTLLGNHHPSLAEDSRELVLVGADPNAQALAGGGPSFEGVSRIDLPPAGRVRSGIPGPPGVAVDPLPALPLRLGIAAQIDTRRANAAAERVTADPRFLGETLEGFSSLVAPEKVWQVRYLDFSGHVYDLSTEGGFYFASGFMSSNCECGIRGILADDEDDEE